jgi:hypothetical protein
MCLNLFAYLILSPRYNYFPVLWSEWVQTVGCVVDGHGISIRTASSSFDVTWAMWKKNYFLPEQAMKL